MKLLVVTDVENKRLYDYYTPGMLDGYDLILSCGDLNRSYLEFLVSVAKCPLFYVRGNHDDIFLEEPPEGCECIEDTLTVYKGLRIVGLGGSYKYSFGKNMYTEKEMNRRIRKLYFKIVKNKGFDILLTHAPARGINDCEDPPHRGFQCFIPLIERFKPKYMLHGHIHSNYGYNIPTEATVGSTKIINAYPSIELEIF